MTRGASAGFTLLETLVATLIVAMALPVIFRGAAGGLALSGEARRYEEAVSRARSHLASIADTGRLVAETQQGDDGAGFRWRVDVTEIGTSSAGFATSPKDDDDDQARPRPPAGMTLYSLAVAETWPAGRLTRSVRLVSERMQPVSGP